MNGNGMNNYKIWDILKAKIYYQDTNKYKIRPIILLDGINGIYLTLKITSNIKRNGLEEYQIIDWQNAGLTKPSNIRLSKLILLPQDYIIEKYGILQLNDRIKMVKQLKDFSIAYNTYYSRDIISKLEKRIDENL